MLRSDGPPRADDTVAVDVVYEDDSIIVVDKPSGLVVHPAPGSPGQDAGSTGC